MTDAEDRAAADSATETHHEPHGAAAPHGAADEAAQHVGDDDAGHAGHAGGGEPGPIDVAAWAAGIGGVALGLIVVACLVVATQGLHAV